MSIIHKSLFILFILLSCFFSFSCVSISIYDTDSFIGQNESVLTSVYQKDCITYYTDEYTPLDLGYDYSFCDKVLYFSSNRVEYTYSKTTVTTYKKTKQSTLYNLYFTKYPDGCCLLNGLHYNHHISADGVGYATHNVGNTYNYLTNFFYNFINKPYCYKFDDNQYAFDNHRIGDVYYLYTISTRTGYSQGAFDGTYPSENYTLYSFYIYKIELIAEDQTDTESHKVYYFTDVKAYVDENGYEISEQEFKNLKSSYISNGFVVNDCFLGSQKLGFIKDGKIIAIGHFNENQEVIIDSIKESK